MHLDIVHGFGIEEFRTRVSRAQALMAETALDGLLLTSMDNIRYFVGIDSTFWESYTRPWFLLVPASGEPIAIVPGIGESVVRQTWITDVRTWPSPRPHDEGTSLVTQAISNLKRRYGRVGAELGSEMRLMMPVMQLNAISHGLSGVEIVDGTSVLWQLRMIKSPAEVSKIQRAIDIAGSVYAQVPDFVSLGTSEREIRRQFTMRLLSEGADQTPVVICRAGPGGPVEITASPSDRPLADGDILFIDTGTVFDGYYCDFDRNFQVGKATSALLIAQERVWEANEVGIRAARPGVTAGHVFEQMAKFLSSGDRDLNSNGRMGHGLGLRITEPPSVKLEDDTVLQPGMVLCIEPGLEYEPGKILLHEETVLITEDGAKLLTSRAPQQLPQLH
ncbi:Xaa-Pro peptidase family protein [Microvirga sp. VF16]|uniref:M24 family metallopeptidase n=1 Tax=Microvirga sp. VF16 TaxID=2807101 RepID=UPI00193E404F|nr:Xaa-Pro peptidase family protein [Microvirga sp. VF16]QRM32262.1 aminopeptidase P family protein [Microvirga sp. VF16]